MAWKVTTNNHIRRDVLSAFEVSDEVLDDLGLDKDDEEDLTRDLVKYRGKWFDLFDFTVDLPEELKVQGWHGWQTSSHWWATLVKLGADPTDHSLPVMGTAEWID